VRELWPLVGSSAGVCGPCVGISDWLEIGVAPWRSGLILTVHFGWLGNGRRCPAKTLKKAADGDVGQWTVTLGWMATLGWSKMGWPATLDIEVEGWWQGNSPKTNETELGELICFIFGRIRCYSLYLSL
jgi:hypothetical protein